jgi:hypothetical protein
MRVVAITLAALAIAAAGAGATTPSRPTAGLHGVVMRGPTMPVCKEEEPCEAPAVGVVLQFAYAGRIVARTKTGAGGAYTVRLRPGIYSVTTPPPRRVGTGLTPSRVRVPAGRLARVDFHLDTGIQ